MNAPATPAREYRCECDLAKDDSATAYFIIDRTAACLALMTDAQALATWERMKAVRKAYVEAIIEKVPA